MRRLVLLLALGLTLAPAACGGGDEAPPGEAEAPDSAVLAAATATERADSYRADMTIRMEGLAAEPVTMSAEGIFQRRPILGRMTMDMSDLGAAAGGGGLGEVDIVMDGLVFYMRMPFLRQLDPSLKPWIRFDLAEIGKQQGFDLGQLMQFGTQTDPAQALAYLRAASDDVETVGSEEVRGVETTRYRMTVELARVPDAAPPGQREALRAQVQQLRELSGIDEVPTDVWVDEDGLVRRQRLLYRDMRLAPGREGDMTMTMELYDFGVDVDVEPPPAGQVTDIATLLERG
ncbi:MAG TPA: hypothetical protein VHF23_02035 [Gaiellaceae bacterium]|nr:hypothetical protein [Gaiellaceae bacterium]